MELCVRYLIIFSFRPMYYCAGKVCRIEFFWTGFALIVVYFGCVLIGRWLPSSLLFRYHLEFGLGKLHT